MKLSPNQLLRWGAIDGASSLVTPDESKKRQITFDRQEKAVLHRVIPADKIWRGKSTAAPPSQRPLVDVYRGLKWIGSWKVRINLAKKEGSETRIYVKSGQFRPVTDDAWFVLDRGTGRLAIGWCAPEDLAAFSAPLTATADVAADEFYQSRIGASLAGVRPGKRRVAETYHRDVRFGVEAIKRSGGSCQLDPSHTTFEWDKTGTNYVECHHLVPVSAAKEFPHAKLDCVENIATLCPTCHRLVHSAKPAERLRAMKKLLSSRPTLLPSLGISTKSALAFYSKRGTVDK